MRKFEMSKHCNNMTQGIGSMRWPKAMAQGFGSRLCLKALVEGFGRRLLPKAVAQGFGPRRWLAEAAVLLLPRRSTEIHRKSIEILKQIH